MKRILIIGGGGFVGHHLILDSLKMEGARITATKLPHETISAPAHEVVDLDVTEPIQIQVLLNRIRPDIIFHLAAQSSVAVSWSNPVQTMSINVNGTLNLLESARSLDYSPSILLIGSGEEYGMINKEDLPLKEDTVLRPGNIYAASKACQGHIGVIYAHSYGMDIKIVRAFNHIGPGQSPVFAVADFCKQIAEIEKGTREPVIRTGNLEPIRDFTDVRDVVNAYVLLSQHGKRGESYNVGSGRGVSIRFILEQLISLSSSHITHEIDPAKLRPADIPVIIADITKIKESTGWSPRFQLEDTLKDTLDEWRKISLI